MLIPVCGSTATSKQDRELVSATSQVTYSLQRWRQQLHSGEIGWTPPRAKIKTHVPSNGAQ